MSSPVPMTASNQLLQLMNPRDCCFATSTSSLVQAVQPCSMIASLSDHLPAATDEPTPSLQVRDNQHSGALRFSQALSCDNCGLDLSFAAVPMVAWSRTASLRFNFEYQLEQYPVPSGPRPGARPYKISSHDSEQ